MPYGLIHKYGGTEITYYYEYNLQGDIIGIISDAGTRVVSYEYSAWGELLSTSGSMASNIGAANPLRYRGYYYDTETGFYYLQSRYYDPVTCRFINADGIVAGIGGSIQGYNMFTYCMNNPVNMIDSSGNWPQWIKDAANWVDKNIIEPVERFVEDITEDISNYNKENTDVDVVYESNYFSSYNGTLVIRHSSNFLTSWGAGGMIFLNHSNDSRSDRTTTLKHEYGHILQEKELGPVNYIIQVFAPSVTYNLISRYDDALLDNYYSMPWEYDADMRGGVKRNHASWAEDIATEYFELWGW